MNFANVGISGLILIVIVLVLVFGPSKLPELGKAFGKSLREFKDATRGLTEEVSSAMKADERPTQSAPAPQPQMAQASTVHPMSDVSAQETGSSQAAEPIELRNPAQR